MSRGGGLQVPVPVDLGLEAPGSNLDCDQQPARCKLPRGGNNYKLGTLGHHEFLSASEKGCHLSAT